MIPSGLTLAHEDNLIALCPTCHAAYNAEYPYWIMVPTIATLNRYVQHERQDYQNRAAAAAQGEVIPRTLPDIVKEEVEYHRFLFSPGWASSHCRHPHAGVKTWGGEPTTAVFKAIRALAQPCEVVTCSVGRGSSVQVGVMESVRSKVMELVRAWSQPPPQIAEVLVGGTSDGGGGQWATKTKIEGKEKEGHGGLGRRQREMEGG